MSTHVPLATILVLRNWKTDLRAMEKKVSPSALFSNMFALASTKQITWSGFDLNSFVGSSLWVWCGCVNQRMAHRANTKLVVVVTHPSSSSSSSGVYCHDMVGWCFLRHNPGLSRLARLRARSIDGALLDLEPVEARGYRSSIVSRVYPDCTPLDPNT